MVQQQGYRKDGLDLVGRVGGGSQRRWEVREEKAGGGDGGVGWDKQREWGKGEWDGRNVPIVYPATILLSRDSKKSRKSL